MASKKPENVSNPAGEPEVFIEPVQGAEPSISEAEARAAAKAEGEARAARARAEGGATVGIGGLQVGNEAEQKAAEKRAAEKVTALQPIIDPASQQLVGYKEVTVTRAEAERGLSATTPNN